MAGRQMGKSKKAKIKKVKKNFCCVLKNKSKIIY